MPLFFMPFLPPTIAQVEQVDAAPKYIAEGSKPRAASEYRPKIKYIRLKEIGVDWKGKISAPPIKYMRLPESGWWIAQGISPNSSSYGYSFSPTKYGDASLSLSFSESDKRPQLGKLFEKEPHDLSEEEKAQCLDHGNVNKLARTVIWNQRKVLEIEETGDICMEPTHIYELIIDSGTNPGPGPENFTPVIVRFYAKEDAYQRYIGSVKNAMKTIRWKEN